MAGSDRPHKVAVGAMVRFAYRSVFGRLELLLEVGWIMLLALLAMLIVPSVLLPARLVADAPRLDAIDLGEILVGVLTLTAFAVRWHQSILLGDPRRLAPDVFVRSWVRFLAYGFALYILIGAIIGVAALALSLLPDDAIAAGLIELVAVVLVFLVAMGALRCAMVFPAAARGTPIGLGKAWRLLRGNSWRLALASFLAALPVTAATAILTATVITLALPAGSEFVVVPPLGFIILTGVIGALSNMLLVALGASLLSGFYRELAAWRGGGAADEPVQR